MDNEFVSGVQHFRVVHYAMLAKAWLISRSKNSREEIHYMLDSSDEELANSLISEWAPDPDHEWDRDLLIWAFSHVKAYFNIHFPPFLKD